MLFGDWDLAVVAFGPAVSAIVAGLALDLRPWSKVFKLASLIVLAAALLYVGWSWDVLRERTRGAEMGGLTIGFTWLAMKASLIPPMVCVFGRRVRSIGLISVMAFALPYIDWW